MSIGISPFLKKRYCFRNTEYNSKKHTCTHTISTESEFAGFFSAGEFTVFFLCETQFAGSEDQ
jgi:hypothetical protein